MFKKLLFAVLFLATTASAGIAGVKRHELRKSESVDKRQSDTIPISELPPKCRKICTPAINAINSISTCSSASCICTKTVDNSFQGCINCIVEVDPSGAIVQQLKRLASEYNELCQGSGVSSLSVVAPSTTKGSTTKTSSSKSTHTSSGKTSSTSSGTSTISSPTTTSGTTSSSESATLTGSSPSTSISSPTSSATSVSSVISATGLTGSVSLIPTSTTVATASASATRTSNASIARANAGAGYPLMALIVTLFALVS